MSNHINVLHNDNVGSDMSKIQAMRKQSSYNDTYVGAQDYSRSLSPPRTNKLPAAGKKNQIQIKREV